MSVAKNRIVLTQPTRRLTGGSKVLLVMTPIFTSKLNWREDAAYIPYWRTPNPVIDQLLGHFVTVFDFEQLLWQTLESSGLACSFGLSDITDTALGRSILAAEDASLAADEQVGQVLDPSNATSRMDASPMQPIDAGAVMGLAGSQFLYSYSTGWASGKPHETSTASTEDDFKAYFAQASGSKTAITAAGYTIVGARVFAMVAATSPSAVPIIDSLTAAVIAGCVAFSVLIALVAAGITLTIQRDRLDKERREKEAARVLRIAHRTHGELSAHMSTSKGISDSSAQLYMRYCRPLLSQQDLIGRNYTLAA